MYPRARGPLQKGPGVAERCELHLHPIGDAVLHSGDHVGRLPLVRAQGCANCAERHGHLFGYLEGIRGIVSRPLGVKSLVGDHLTLLCQK